ncbi:sigma-70 family RNA polymerase sigma factor [Ornithinimicrobium sp. W1665]|uniref:sigma-70 family RNA polymerase sigma factor n=1 Tax=Ornithinimicrobium sp. W1665 TaxID=3416666 RepID=UPI003CF1BAD1
MSPSTRSTMMDVVPMSSRRRRHDDYRDFFVGRYPQVVRTVWFVVHDWAVAEEVAQDAFLELYRDWSRLREFDRPDLWVRRVAIRRAQREAARRMKREAVEQAAADPAPVDDGIRLLDPDLVAAIRDLPARQRAVVVLYYLEDLPMAEVADLVGCSTSTGFVHLHHARKRLAAALTLEVDDDVR